MRYFSTRCFATCAAAGALALGASAHAQFPERAVTLIVPLPQGDIAHLAARLVAGKLTERWGRAVFADSKPGNAGGDANAEVAKAKPDGHTLLIGTLATQVIRPLVDRSAAAGQQNAVAPVVLLIEVPMVILVASSTKVRSLRDLASAAKAKAPPLKSISGGGGDPPHVAALLFEAVSKIPLEHALAKDHREAVDELAKGATVAFVSMPQALEHIKSGKVRALALTSAQRSPALPKLHTVAESGFPGYELSSWTGLFAPAATPAATIERVATDANRAMAASDVRHALEQRGATAVGGDTAQFRARVERDRERNTRLLKEKGLAPG